MYIGNDGAVRQAATSARVDGELLLTLLRWTLKPTLWAYAESLASVIVEHNLAWRKGMCPACGAPPLLSEYDDSEGARHLRCASCGTRWLFFRLQCPHCGTDKSRLLGHLTVEGDKLHRVDTCDNCHRYLKSLTAFDPTPSEWLPLEDLATMTLDAAAQQQGYSR